MYSDIATMKFDAFGYISSTTPVYALDEEEPWIFYHDQLGEEPGSFYYAFSQGGD
ncbi:MAG: hypothetical protein R2751_15995 [Bacteroidales bacterium]